MKGLKTTLIFLGILTIEIVFIFSLKTAEALYLGQDTYMINATSNNATSKPDEIRTIPEGAIGIIDFEQIEGEGRVGSIESDALEAYPNIYDINTGWGPRASYEDIALTLSKEVEELGKSLRIDYDVSNDLVFVYMKIEGINIKELREAGYQYLVFDLKGTDNENFKVELKTDSSFNFPYHHDVQATENVKRVYIPLTEFKSDNPSIKPLIELDEDLREIVFVFRPIYTTPETGTIWIDNIYFAQSIPEENG